MSSTPAQTTQAHKDIQSYRNALDDAERASHTLRTAVGRAKAAAGALQSLARTPIAALEWTGAPPVGEWRQAFESIVIPQVKAGLKQ